MDEAAMQEWQRLRTRVNQGETLSASEQQIYTQRLQAMEAEETFPDSLERLRRARQRTQELKAEYAQMQARYAAMEAEIVRLEARLNEPAKQLLGVGN